MRLVQNIWKKLNKKVGIYSALVFYLILIIIGWNIKNRAGVEDDDKKETVDIEATIDLTTIDWKYEGSSGIGRNLLTAEKDIIEQLNQGTLEYAQAEEESDEYSNFAIADVDNYVNVRSEPNTESSVVGKMYDGAVAQIQDTVSMDDGEWLHVTSGNATGYIKAEYFIYGDAAVQVIEEYVDKYARVDCSRLNIREKPDIESARIGYALNNEKLKVVNNEGEWLKVSYGRKKEGYVSAEYVTLVEEFIYAKTIEEEQAEKEAAEALLARVKDNEQDTSENLEIVEQASTPENTPTYTASGNIRTDLVNFALQYVGNPYVHGGNSLVNGTDCSGFTSLVYAQFGYGLSRTPGGQLSSNGTSISLDEIQPGDVVCYGKSRCTHVAIYIGNGQIVHAANPRKGIVTQNVGYDNILGVKRIIN